MRLVYGLSSNLSGTLRYLSSPYLVYDFYYDLWPHKLRYLWKVEELHNKYGPIVRINAIHLHIPDPEYLDDI